ncbi:unnamed protein product [Tetraodon nigroviridis]|uniref:(spotted green pufferfish) hypothetical protein n=1 Tax=Tetraodon nigroviridis TaxID=99883 RepID=Q4RJ24_TETNG|nr:unnamed protein product [Tetraodon nigroviridis]
MSGRRAGLVLLCAALAVSHARRSSPEQEDVQEKIHSARCTSRCLTLHMTQLTAAFRHLQSDQVLDWCDSHRRCAQPCKELWETKRILSPKSCEVRNPMCTCVCVCVSSLVAVSLLLHQSFARVHLVFSGTHSHRSALAMNE